MREKRAPGYPDGFHDMLRLEIPGGKLAAKLFTDGIRLLRP